MLTLPKSIQAMHPKDTYDRDAEFKDFVKNIKLILKIAPAPKPKTKSGKISINDEQYGAYLYHYTFDGEQLLSGGLSKDYTMASLSLFGNPTTQEIKENIQNFWMILLVKK